jgi:hypothetical protein
LAVAAKVRHIVVNESHQRLDAELRKNILSSFCSAEHAWHLAIGDYLQGKTELTYSGVGGDTLLENTYIQPEDHKLFTSRRFTYLAELLMPAARERLAFTILSRKYYQIFNRQRALQRLSDELKTHQAAPNPLGEFYFANRLRRSCIHMVCSLMPGVKTVYLPYLDTDVYDFLASLPAELVLQRRIHTEAIRRAYPAYAHIGYTDKQKETSYARSYALRFSVELVRYAYANHPPTFVRSSFLLPRLIRCAADPRYSRNINYFGAWAIYLIQLERLCGGGKK